MFVIFILYNSDYFPTEYLFIALAFWHCQRAAALFDRSLIYLANF